ncbi:C39 family peptidase [Patescibacteria group bacterium]|nr:C39 family peptidase [Patescibacteria group bacterium]MCL5091942.1 C39 family peptidase [Patescibacteria group bacterium]
MQTVKQSVFKAVLFLKNIATTFTTVQSNTFAYPNLPYYSQWESRSLVDKILNHRIKAENDPNWKNSGAKSQLEYCNWSWNGCGMACLKMILKQEKNIAFPLVTLAKIATKYGAYKINPRHFAAGQYLHSIDGLYYRQFLTFIKNEFNLDGKIASPLTIKEIPHYISRRFYVIASVNASIRNPITQPQRRGGHLVLISGYSLPDRFLYLHNPSGYYRRSQKYAKISPTDFDRFFSHRGILIAG